MTTSIEIDTSEMMNIWGDEYFLIFSPKTFLSGGFAGYLSFAGQKVTGQHIVHLEDFHKLWGIPIPGDLFACLDQLGTFGWPSLYQWSPGFSGLSLPPGSQQEFNLIEYLIEREQTDELTTGFFELLTGSLCIGEFRNGDRYFYALYETESAAGGGPIYFQDHENQDIITPFARNIATLSYLAALGHARFKLDALSPEGFSSAFSKLSGQINMSWHFRELEELAGLVVEDDLATFSPRHSPTRETLQRVYWIYALLRYPRTFHTDDVPQVFTRHLNPAVSDDLHQRWLQEIPGNVPLALYVLFRCYFLDEPENLRQYLQACFNSQSRYIRDTANLVGELQDGRRRLGIIEDLGARRRRIKDFSHLLLGQGQENASTSGGIG